MTTIEALLCERSAKLQTYVWNFCLFCNPCHFLHLPIIICIFLCFVLSVCSLTFSCIVCSFTVVLVQSWKSWQMFFYVLSNQPLILCLPCRPPCCNLLSATWSRRSSTRFPVCPALPWCHLWYVRACRIYEIGETFWVLIVQQNTFFLKKVNIMTENLTWPRHRKNWQMNSSLLILWVAEWCMAILNWWSNLSVWKKARMWLCVCFC